MSDVENTLDTRELRRLRRLYDLEAEKAKVAQEQLTCAQARKRVYHDQITSELHRQQAAVADYKAWIPPWSGE